MTRCKTISGVLFVALVIGQFSLWTAQNGIFDYWNLRLDLQNSADRNARLEARNNRLTGDVVDLKSKADAVEEIARNRLGMIKNDEVFYHVIDVSQATLRN